MTSEKVMADVEVSIRDNDGQPLVELAEKSWPYRPALELQFLEVEANSAPLGDLLRSSSAAAAPLVAPASSRDATRKRSGLLLEAVVNRWDMFASRF